jgi:Family of unknown function (DUF6325)
MGPVQVLVVGFDHPRFSGEVLAEFDRLRGAGVVRLVDLLLVSRAEDGSLESVALPAGSPPELGAVAAALLGGGADADRRADEREEDALWSLAAVPPGSMAAVALIEHLWAEPLTAALERAGGRALEETWLGPDDREALEALLRRPAAGQGEPASSGR